MTEQTHQPPKLQKTPSGEINANSLADLLEWFLNFDQRVALVRHPHVEELFEWKQADDAANGIEVYPFENAEARFAIGDVVRHRMFDFRGVIFDVDPVFANSEEWYEAIPEEIRPPKDQPFYHLLAENAETEYIAYVSEQNLLPDESGEPVRHPDVRFLFGSFEKGFYRSRETPN